MFNFDSVKWQDEYITLMSVKINTQSTLYSTLQQKASQLRNSANSVYGTVTSDVRALALVDALGVKNYSAPRLYEQLVQRVKDNPDDMISKERLQKIVNDFQAAANTFDGKIGAIIGTLNNIHDLLDKNTRKDLTTLGFPAQLRVAAQNCVSAINDHTQYLNKVFLEPIAKLTAEVKELDSTIEKQLNLDHILKVIKDLQPSEKQVGDLIENGSKSEAAMGMEVIKLAYSTAVKAIDVIGSVITLCSNITQQNKLYKKLNELKENYDKGLEKLKVLNQNYDEVMGIATLNILLIFWIKNSKEIADYLTGIRISLKAAVSNCDFKSYTKVIDEFEKDIVNSGLK